MLYILHGEDFKKRIKKLEELTGFFLGKKPDTVLVKVNGENFSGYDLEELAGEQGLFERKCVVLLEGLFDDAEAKEKIISKFKTLSASENLFIINEHALGKGDLTAIKKYAEKVQEFLSEEKSPRPAFNIFSLSDAVGERDKKRAWVLFMRAVAGDSAPEEIHGTIFWQVKNMLLVKEAKNPTQESTGLKAFVLGKARSFSKNYSKEELRDFSSRLVSLYHDSHRGIGDFSTGLEKLILEKL